MPPSDPRRPLGLATTGASRPTKKRGKASSKKPTQVDEHVAKRIRLRRVLLGLSQDELAKRLGVTAQQVQKYEAGESRVSASRLYAIALHLAVPIMWFFAELDDNPDRQDSERAPPGGEGATKMGKPDLSDLMSRREARDLVEVYFRISDAKLRRKVLEMAGLLTKLQDE